LRPSFLSLFRPSFSPLLTRGPALPPFSEGADEFPKDTLAYVLAQHGVLKFDGPPPDEVDEDTGAVNPKGLNAIDMRRAGKGAIREGGMAASAAQEEDSDDDVDAYLEGYEEPGGEEDDAGRGD
jgi:hypothetical protein